MSYYTQPPQPPPQPTNHQPPQEYVAAHLKLSELGVKFAEGTPITLDA